jgi:hypothetical protein
MANKRAVRMRGPGEIAMVFGFISIPPAPIKIIAHGQAGCNARQFQRQNPSISKLAVAFRMMRDKTCIE